MEQGPGISGIESIDLVSIPLYSARRSDVDIVYGTFGRRKYRREKLVRRIDVNTK